MKMLYVRLEAVLMVMGAILFIASAPAPAQGDRQSESDENEAAQSAAAGGEDRKTEFHQKLLVTAAHPELSTETVFLGREIEQNSGEDLGYFLRGQAGVTAFRRGPIGLDPQVRGLQETQVGIFVDGTRTFAAGPGRMDSAMAHVSPRAVERMRVVKGPYALTWGAGTLSAIQLDTFRPAFEGDQLRLGGRMGFAYGDNASASDGYANTWGSGEKIRFQALVQGRSGDDWEDGEGNTIAGDYRSQDARWSLGYRLGTRGLVEYTGGYQEQKDVDYPGRQLDADYFYTRSHAVEVQWTPEDSGVELVSAQLYANRKDHRMNNDEKPSAQAMPGRMPPFGLDVVLPTESNTSGAKVKVNGAWGEYSWTAGFDSYFLEQTATRSIYHRDTAMLLFENFVWPEVSIDDLGTYIQLARKRPNSTLVGTLRADFVDAAAGRPSDFFRENTSGNLDQSETNVSAAVSGRFRVGNGWTMTGGVGSAVRTASALERYSDRMPSSKFQIAAEFMGNPGIEPETALQLDLGTEYRSSELVVQIEGFVRSIEDYITVEPAPTIAKRMPMSPFVYSYVNGADAEFVGGEVRIRHRISDLVEWRAMASYVRGEDKLFDEPIFGLPPLTGKVGLRITPRSEFWVDFDLTTVDRQDRVAVARFEQATPGYAHLDLLVGYEPSSTWRLSLGVDNVADKRYVNHLNSLNPFTGERIAERGLNVHAAIEYSF
jgi:iron complex outermembrane receptor protein